MKVAPTGELHGPEKPHGARAEAPTQAQPLDSTTDRVTIEGRQVAEQLDAAKLRSDVTRSGRLQQLAASISGGHYRPDAGQLAERLLSSAEIEARLLALLRG